MSKICGYTIKSCTVSELDENNSSDTSVMYNLNSFVSEYEQVNNCKIDLQKYLDASDTKRMIVTIETNSNSKAIVTDTKTSETYVSRIMLNHFMLYLDSKIQYNVLTLLTQVDNSISDNYFKTNDKLICYASDLESKKKEHDELTKDIDSLKTTKSDILQRIDDLKKNKKDIEDSVTDTKKDLERVKKEIELSNKELDVAKLLNKQCNEYHDIVTREIDVLKIEIEQRKKERGLLSMYQ